MRLSLFLLLSFISYSSQAQKMHIVPFEKRMDSKEIKYGSSQMISPKKVVNYSFLKGIPSSDEIYGIYSVTINPERKKYDAYLSKQITRQKYDEYIYQQDIDTTLFSVAWNEFYIYVGINKDLDKKYIIIDTNNSLDFSDDQSYTFYLKDYYQNEDKSLFFQNIDIKAPDETIIHLALDPFKSKDVHAITDDEVISNKDKLLEIVLETRDFMQGTITINGYDVYINEIWNDNLLSKRINKTYPFQFIYKDTISNSVLRRIGDTVSIAGQKIYIQKAIENKLYLEDLGAIIDSSRIGSYLPALYSIRLENSKAIYLNELMKNKFVFIDFWGSWCGPCIVSLPKLKDLHDKVKNNDTVLILGVALEDEKDLDKLQKIIKDNEVEWLNVWNENSTRKIMSSLHGKLSVEQFPTYMIIDNTGRIVYRETSMYKTKEAIDFFINLIQSNGQ